MSFPFDVNDFLAVFAAYNTAVWPGQLALTGIAALAAFAAAVFPEKKTAFVPVVLLALLWAWSGLVYHLMFFTRINPAALTFAAFFVLNAALLMFAFARGRIRLSFRSSLKGWVGAFLMLHALIGYQLTTLTFGHLYPSAPTFGAPCPLVIFTFGLLLWNRRATPWYVVIIPVAWAVAGTISALGLQMTEDFALPLSAIAFAIVTYRSRVTFAPVSRPTISPARSSS